MMTPKKELEMMSSKNTKEKNKPQPSPRGLKLTHKELSSMMCIQITKEGLRLKKPEIPPLYNYPVFPKTGAVPVQPTEPVISPPKVIEDTSDEEWGATGKY
ncbi:hypothetical protein C922_05563 [Plasmodium inui San Antonio 1]|uniref:Uncharacterized protein n=1 Tax=Plasmodium inui San Antonio 1 TaxID=1237626 RepID=W7AFK1_9APIC|nr:hypothetical protein C922_05563 [Plasmodium inui San Antonio 1]EUD64056.1 hypothetical protein C922_05563 [Plasmodium inui San Antonio 1]